MILALVLIAAFTQDTVGGQPYVKLETRAATQARMLELLAPRELRWGEAWLLWCFPYKGHGRNDLATPFPPERELANMHAGGPGPDLVARYVGKRDREVRWESLGAFSVDKYDFNKSGDPRLDDNAQCYLYTTVTADRAQLFECDLGSDDGLRVWFNGKLIHHVDEPRSLDPHADHLRLDLHAGVNHLLFKVCEGGGGWDLQVLFDRPLPAAVEAELVYLLDRDFPPSREREHYRVLTYPLPEDLVLEVGGLAFLSDHRPVVTTRRGDVFLVENAYEEPPRNARFQLFASGLHEPLGVAVRQQTGSIITCSLGEMTEHGGRGCLTVVEDYVYDAIYTVQRGELTLLLDDDGDSRADTYETFCDAWGVSGNYHEFAFGPKFDREGNAWVTLNVGFCGGLGKSIVPWRGWALKIDREGVAHPVACGLRSPNGIGMWSDGEMFYVDNQGDWVGTNRMTHLAQDSWHGHPSSLHWREDWKDGSGPMPPLEPAAVWFPYQKMGQSTADILLVETGGKFGPFEGQLLVGDQWSATVERVFLEKIGERYQGACFPFLSGFQSGVNRLAFAHDGSLLVGMTDRGWGSVGKRSYGLQRVVYNGVVPFEILAMRVRANGFELEFTQDVDPASAIRPSSYSMSSYTYEHHAQYGSAEMDTREVAILGAELVAPRRVRLTVAPLRTGYVHELWARGVRSRGGAELLHAQAYYTLQALPGG